MKHLFKKWKDIGKILKGRKLLLFLDYDGTLAAIVDHYKSATILQESKMLLRQLTKNSECRVVIISGRALSDVKKRVGLKNIIYIGNHGLEVAGPGIPYMSFVETDTRRLFHKIKSDLAKRVGGIQGVLIEDKSLTLSIHYRLVRRKDLVLFKQLFLESIWIYFKNQKIDFYQGKKVFEIKPPVKWNKGDAALWLIKRLQNRDCRRKVLPIFIGDDATDETAFIALKHEGLCIRVGCAKTSEAQYCLRDINQVARFLEIILDFKDG
jgi:trehalose-phosphatase